MLKSLLLSAGLASARVLEQAPRSYGLWERTGPAPQDAIMDVTVALKHEPTALARLEQTFWEVSDPKSPSYGKYLSVDELTSMVAPPEAKVRKVFDFLAAGGTDQIRVDPNRDLLRVRLSVQVAEELFEAKIFQFQHQVHKGTVMRAGASYGISNDEVAELVSVVGGLLEFPDIMQLQERTPAEATMWPDACSNKCTGKITPAVINKLYSVDADTSSVQKGNSMAVAEFQGQYFDQGDLDTFTEACKLPSIKVIEAGEKNDPSQCTGIFGNCIEALLDLEYIGGLAPNVPLTDVYANKYSLLDWASTLAGDDAASIVHSVSYGNDEDQQSSTAYMLSCNTQFMKLGARGISVLFASGDQGVWGREGPGSKFHADFPAGSPYITSVGGTDFSSKDGSGPEVGCKDGGGGFSETFALPDFQSAAVKGYFNSGVDLPAAKYYNASGRGYPDIAANFGAVVPYCVVNKGSEIGVGGTSASSPVVAGIVALLNDVRLKAGKPVLGFLNPFLYQTLAQHPEAFTDITTGENKASGSVGFKASKGWDPVTGVGVPNYSALAKIVLL